MGQGETINISLVIPVYNVSPYIERCLKSIIGQTHDRFECILVDDASPDDSIAKSEKVIADYKGPIRFRILHHEKNRGLSAARNTGTEAATGDYVLYVDSDDFISNDCVEKLLAPVLRDDSIEMVLGERLLVSEAGPIPNQRNRWRQREDLKSHEEVRDLFFDRSRFFPAAAWNKLTRRSFITQHQLWFEEGQLVEDTLWTFFVMKHLCHLYVIPDITYFYYFRPDSIVRGTREDVLARHGSIVYDMISRNFTPGDEGRESAHYVGMFGRFSLSQSISPELKKTAKRYGKVLPFMKYPKEKILLWVAGILPHNKKGRIIYETLRKRFLRRAG